MSLRENRAMRSVFRFIYGTNELMNRQKDSVMAAKIDKGVETGTMYLGPIERADAAIISLNRKMEEMEETLNHPATSVEEAMQKIASRR